MIKILFQIILVTTFCLANDSAYYTMGNHLVPIKSKNIELQKEIINLKYIGNGSFKVNIYYKLFNNGNFKKDIVGFEAPLPYNDNGEIISNDFFCKKYDISKLNKKEKEAIKRGYRFNNNYWKLVNKVVSDINKKSKKKKVIDWHYWKESNYLTGIKDFKVLVNGVETNWKLSYLTNLQNIGSKDKYDAFIYYFNVNFFTGVNIIEHSYIINCSQDAINEFIFEYILSTATRWKGGKIKEFILNIDMGKFGYFRIYPTFFDSLKNWHIENGFALKNKDENNNKVYDFFIRSGKVTFYKKNFFPKDKIYINSPTNNINDRIFDTNSPLYFNSMNYKFATNLFNLKIIKSLPYARRGVVFKNKKLLNYFKKFKWYKETKKDIKYINLTHKEELYLEKIEFYKYKILRNLPYAKQNYDFNDWTLKEFFGYFDWYEAKTKKIKPLNTEEKQWLNKILKKKNISDKEFFDLLNEYIDINI